MYVLQVVIIFCFFFVSCDHQKNNFETQTRLHWNAGVDVVKGDINIREGQNLLAPKGAWLTLMEIIYLGKDFGNVSDCVFFKVPKDSDGILKIVANEKNLDCKDLSYDDGYSQWEKIQKFSYQFQKGVLTFKIDEKEVVYSFLNYVADEVNQLFDYSAKKMPIKAVMVAIMENHTKAVTKLQNGTVCFKVGDGCEAKTSNNCDLCENGYYPIVDSNCGRAYTLVCGENKCGERGENACVRGRIATNYTGDYCIQDSPVGFCKKDFRVGCENKRLVCQ